MTTVLPKKWWQQQGDEDDRIIEACMKYTDVLDMAERPIRALSGGQRQRKTMLMFRLFQNKNNNKFN